MEGDLIMNTHYGNLNIDNYGTGFSMMNLAAKYTDVSMICQSGSGCYLEVYYDRKTKMIYPTDLGSFVNKEIDSDEGEYLLNGQCGLKEEGAPRIKITLNGGSINLIHH